MTEPFWSDDLVTLYHGDCLDVLRELPDASVDAVVTDPPYSLSFMSREWDRHDGPHDFQQWCEQWARECLRALKPGGHLLAFGGTRTWHRLACAIEDAGFEIRDSLHWIYGSGFPKSLDVSKAIDRQLGERTTPIGSAKMNDMRAGDYAARAGNGLTEVPVYGTEPVTEQAKAWQGWGTAMKPSHEPIVVARKPLAGTVAANVLAWGCGAINVGACRVGPTSGGTEGSLGETGSRGCPVHGLPHLREANEEAPLARGARQASRDVQPSMPVEDDVAAAESQVCGRGLDGTPFRLPEDGNSTHDARGSGATALSATSRGLRASDGGSPNVGAAVALDGDGSSSEWAEGRQPPGEPACHRLEVAQQGAPVDRTGVDGAASGKRSTPRCTCADAGVTAGRWPSNVVLGHLRECEQVGTVTESVGGGAKASGGFVDGYESGDGFAGRPVTSAVWRCADGGCPVRELDRQSGVSTSTGGKGAASGLIDNAGIYGTFSGENKGASAGGLGDTGGASRFFPTFRFEPKAPTAQRPRVDDVAHPTVKPLDLMRWLVRLVTPPGGTVLEPFAGSGTTAEACVIEGFRCIAIEREDSYLPLIVARLTKPIQPDLFGAAP